MLAALADTAVRARLQGGFDKSTKADFDTTNGKSMRYGGVGGLAGAMGWTKVQEQEEPEAQFAGGPMRVIAFIAVLAALDYAWIGACSLGVPGTRTGHCGPNQQLARLPGVRTALKRMCRAAGYDFFFGTGK